MNPLAHELAEQTGELSAEALLAHVVRRLGSRAALASSLGVEDQVLTDMLFRLTDEPVIFTLDTGRLPPESYQTIEETSRRYGRPIRVFFPDFRQVEPMVNEHGVNLFVGSAEARRLCCRVRKVEPLARALTGLDAWITGLRREQALTRAGLERIEWDPTHRLVKVNPLADWTTEQVWDYVRRHDVPYNPLHDRGYPSIGCAPCTRAVEPGQDIRAGRWWWEQPEHKECGLHPTTGSRD